MLGALGLRYDFLFYIVILQFRPLVLMGCALLVTAAAYAIGSTAEKGTFNCSSVHAMYRQWPRGLEGCKLQWAGMCRDADEIKRGIVGARAD